MISQYVMNAGVDGSRMHTDSIDIGDDTIVRHYIDYNPDDIQQYIVDLTTAYNKSESDVHHFTHPLMFFIAKAKPKNSIITVHDCTVDKFYDAAGSFKFRQLYKDFDKVLTVSEFSKRDISNTYNIDMDRIDIIHNSVDTDVYYNDREKQFDSIRLLYVGSLLPHKNIGFIFDLVKEIRKCTDKDVSFVRLGYNNDANEKLPFNLTSMYNVGMVTNTNFFYNNTNVYVTPSLYEGFNIPIIEAMATDTMVIASDLTVHPEIMGGRGVSGAGFCLDLDVELWAQAVLDVECMTNSFSQKRNDVVEKYSPSNTVKQLISVYNSMY